MSPLARRLRRDCFGATAVEMAFILPGLLALVMGIMEAGRMAWTQSTLSYAVQEAGRCASVRPTVCGSTSQIQAFAAERAAPLNIPASAFSVQDLPCGRQVTAEVDYGFLLYVMAPSAPALRARSCRA